jgi:nickel/cobalt transporter (NiCoT) family protein
MAPGAEKLRTVALPVGTIFPRVLNADMSPPFRQNIRKRVIGIYGFLIAVNLAIWMLAIMAFKGNAVLIGTALIAYSFGLRHAVDADHIAAIDNVTRKLMQEGKRPLLVGLFFSLGHSTIVVIAACAVYLTATTLETQIMEFKQIASAVGTSISASFLFVIAGMNILIFRDIYRTFQNIQSGGEIDHHEPDALLAQGGIFGNFFRPLFKILSKSWQMYPVGILFGLGFDTATEIALLGIAASAAAKGLSIGSMMLFPALFTAGMTLIDTTDGIVMVGAYGWAFLKPMRKLYYNMSITLVSVVVALIVGGMETVGLLRDKFNLKGGIWNLFGNLNESFGNLGFFIIAVFVLSWIASMLFYRLKGFDSPE